MLNRIYFDAIDAVVVSLAANIAVLRLPYWPV